MRIGLIGAGLMGHGIGLRLLQKNFPLSVYANRNRAPIDDLVSKGASEASASPTLGRRSDIIIICVSNSDIVGNLLQDLKPSLHADQIIIDAGTSRPKDTIMRAQELLDLGIAFVDCPLTGGPAQAAAGTLGVLCGGSKETIAKITPVLECFATTIRHMGETGAGHKAKLISNFLVTGMIALVSESFAAAARSNLDPQALFDAMENGSGNSGVLQKMVEPALRGDFDGYQFAIGNALKDIGYYSASSDATALSIAIENFFSAATTTQDASSPVSFLLKRCLKSIN